jgi:hypothetical protein
MGCWIRFWRRQSRTVITLGLWSVSSHKRVNLNYVRAVLPYRGEMKMCVVAHDFALVLLVFQRVII